MRYPDGGGLSAEARAKREQVRFQAAEIFAAGAKPAEVGGGGVWSNLKGRPRNLAVRGLDHLAAIVKSHLKRMRYRPGLLDGITAATGLHLGPP